MFSQFVFVMEQKIIHAIRLLMNVRFLFSFSSSQDTCAIVWQVFGPAKLPT